VLYLKPGTREHFLENLARDWPELLPMYEDLYAGRAYVAKDVVEPVKRQVRELAARHGVADRRVRRPIQAGAGPDDAPVQLPLAVALVPPGSEARALRGDAVG
jgi:hypothetical protein